MLVTNHWVNKQLVANPDLAGYLLPLGTIRQSQRRTREDRHTPLEVAALAGSADARTGPSES